VQANKARNRQYIGPGRAKHCEIRYGNDCGVHLEMVPSIAAVMACCGTVNDLNHYQYCRYSSDAQDKVSSQSALTARWQLSHMLRSLAFLGSVATRFSRTVSNKFRYRFRAPRLSPAGSRTQAPCRYTMGEAQKHFVCSANSHQHTNKERQRRRRTDWKRSWTSRGYLKGGQERARPPDEAELAARCLYL
jgi:hypothetical protein